MFENLFDLELMQLERTISLELLANQNDNLRGNEIPCAVAKEVIGIFPYWSLENLLPVFEIPPGLISRRPSKWWETGQGLEEHTS